MASKNNYPLSVIILTVVLLSAVAKSQLYDELRPCESKITCQQCIQTPFCAWCMQEDYDVHPRCFQLTFADTNKCPDEFTLHPQNSLTTLINRQLTGERGSAASGSASGDIVQIRPQRVSVKLRLNQDFLLTIKYSTAGDLAMSESIDKKTSSVEIKDNAPSYVNITYESACLVGRHRIATNKCDGLKVGDVVGFDARITVTSCPQDPKEWFQSFQIYPVGTNESLVVDLEIMCDCPCEQRGQPNYEENSQKCNFVGTYKCGGCHCNEGRFGRNCECTGNNTFVDSKLVCRKNDYFTAVCSGQGLCICGKCKCLGGTYGEFCECDNFSCAYSNGLVCSGPDHGTCDCGVCTCKPGWTGIACDCTSSTDTCTKDAEICSGQGDCECGVCKCKVNEEGRYSGKYCERCPTCYGRCHELKDCVQCQIYKTGPLVGPDCLRICTTFTPIEVDELEYDEQKDEFICAFFDEDDCKYQFVYAEKEGDKARLEVRAKKERECPNQVYKDIFL